MISNRNAENTPRLNCSVNNLVAGRFCLFDKRRWQLGRVRSDLYSVRVDPGNCD